MKGTRRFFDRKIIIQLKNMGKGSFFSYERDVILGCYTISYVTIYGICIYNGSISLCFNVRTLY